MLFSVYFSTRFFYIICQHTFLFSYQFFSKNQFTIRFRIWNMIKYNCVSPLFVEQDNSRFKFKLILNLRKVETRKVCNFSLLIIDFLNETWSKMYIYVPFTIFLVNKLTSLNHIWANWDSVSCHDRSNDSCVIWEKRSFFWIFQLESMTREMRSRKYAEVSEWKQLWQLKSFQIRVSRNKSVMGKVRIVDCERWKILGNSLELFFFCCACCKNNVCHICLLVLVVLGCGCQNIICNFQCLPVRSQITYINNITYHLRLRSNSMFFIRTNIFFKLKKLFGQNVMTTSYLP